jgi:hypothetical protein
MQLLGVINPGRTHLKHDSPFSSSMTLHLWLQIHSIDIRHIWFSHHTTWLVYLISIWLVNFQCLSIQIHFAHHSQINLLKIPLSSFHNNHSTASEIQTAWSNIPNSIPLVTTFRSKPFTLTISSYEPHPLLSSVGTLPYNHTYPCLIWFFLCCFSCMEFPFLHF